MLMHIKEPTNIEDRSLAESLVPYTRQLEAMLDTEDDEIVMDLSGVKFIYPSYLAFLLLLRDRNPDRLKLTGGTSYLKALRFPDCISAGELLEGDPAGRTYLPIVRIRQDIDSLREANAAIDALARLVRRNVDVTPEVDKAVQYILSETLDNYREHSEGPDAYIMCQAYPRKRYLDIVIADNGKGVRDSYRRAGHDIRTDLKAMKLLASAISSKDLPDNESRGYGLSTSRRIATEALDGEFMCVSRSCAYVKKAGRELFLDMRGLGVPGTVTALRLRYDRSDFDLNDYIER